MTEEQSPCLPEIRPRTSTAWQIHQAVDVFLGSGKAGFELRGVAGESDRNLRECAVEAAGKELHAGDCAECDQGHDERVLDQILTFFPSHQRLESEIHLDHQIIHCCEFSISWVGVPVIDWW